MRISTRGEYGLRALMELGMEPDTAHSLRDIATRQHISLDYLEQIVPSLKAAGLIKARRGAHGGYQLAKAPEEITAYDALVALEGPLDPMACLSSEVTTTSCLASGTCAVQEVWSDMKQAVEAVLKQKTLADMIARQSENFKVPIRTYSEREIARLVVLN
jgi:Rrf2 family transcriptional regulator, cysteine metabolism repressor